MKKLEVRLTHAPGQERVVGQLAEAEHRVYFEYDPVFLQSPTWLSPFKLPPEPGLHEHRDLAFGPLFGLFDDSLPDGWGLLLMDRCLKRRGVALETVSPLDRLAYLGTRTMGALTYHPPALLEDRDRELMDLQVMSREAHRVLQGTSGDVLPQLLRAGGSPGGARPKVLVGIRGMTMISGEDDLPEGYTHWLVKFHTAQAARDDGCIEYAYAAMARAAGLRVPATRLLETSGGDRFFGVERFDRQANRRIHVHTLGNLIHANFRIPGCDYATLLKVARVLTKNHADVAAAFRLMVFNLLAHNRDDHVKNVAFMLNSEEEWQLAPAYDLTFARGPGGEHTMTVDGEGRAPGYSHIRKLAAAADLSGREVAAVVEAVSEAVAGWPRFARVAGVSKESTRTINAEIRQCLKRLGP